jgi:hypothetical protein
MPRPTLPILAAAVLLIGLLAFAQPTGRATPQPKPQSAPSLQRIREAIELSVVEADIAAITTASIAGYSGSVRCCVIAQGTARIGVDLDDALIERIDHDARQLAVRLPQPRVMAVRIDHEASQLYSLDRTGLWRLLPFATREGEVTATAWSKAERSLHDAAQQQELIRRARDRTERLLTAALAPLGWSATVAWTPP